MIRVSVYGRLGADPVERETRGGKPMATVSIAVNAARPDADPDTEWFSVIAFGQAAKDLLRHAKGDLCAIMGALQRTRYTRHDGTEREGWSLTCDSIVSARTVRPGGGRKRARATTAAPVGNGAPVGGPAP